MSSIISESQRPIISSRLDTYSFRLFLLLLNDKGETFEDLFEID